ncbi:MAG TPA: type II toxin-antitoxin system RelE/ParE family toxin [Alicyclobacillus sp.]|nr:type II toxin-antitoxin system RelE/ParE family toxin [Alicyclobacillus sp.]
MYEIVVYRNARGKSEIADFLARITEDAGAGNKDAVALKRKLDMYLHLWSKQGTRLGRPYVDHIEGPIWELRPGRYRVLFVGWRGNKFVLLHQFVKKTQKTPRREIEKARREYEDWIERHGP